VAKRCPTCGQVIKREGRKCHGCGMPIRRHDKFFFDGSIVRHHDCANPQSYATKKAKGAPVQGGGLFA